MVTPFSHSSLENRAAHLVNRRVYIGIEIAIEIEICLPIPIPIPISISIAISIWKKHRNTIPCRTE